MAFMSDEQKKSVLQGLELFAGLEENDFARLSKVTRIVEYKNGQTIFRKEPEFDDQASKAMYVVVNGRVMITSQSYVNDVPKKIVFNIMNPGEVFGEIAFLDNGSRTADAAALGKCSLLVLERRDFIPLVRDNSDMALGLLTVLCERIRRSTDYIEDASFLDLEARLAKKLVSFSEGLSVDGEQGLKLDLDVSQSDLGAMVDATREAVNRRLGQWESAGIVRREKGKIYILDIETLEDIADQDGII